MKLKYAFRKDKNGVSPVVGTILMVAITVVLAAILYVMASSLFTNTSITPMLSASKTIDGNNDHIWIVSSITGGPILQSEVFVQLQNESGFVISTEPLYATGDLSGCNGTHGFHYAPASGSGQLSVGDEFFLDTAYETGCTLRLVNPDATATYTVFTV